MTRTWRLESLALLGLWVAATALLLLAARIPQRPVRWLPAAHAVLLARVPTRRPPTAHAAAVPAMVAAEEPVEVAAAVDEAVHPEIPDEPPVEVVESESIDGTGLYDDSYADEPFDPNLEYYRWQYRLRDPAARWSRTGHIRRGRTLRPTAELFLGAGGLPVGASGDPCDVFPGACSAVAVGGGSFAPSVAASARTRVAALAHREYGAPAEVTRDGDLWRLVNDQLSLTIDGRCLVTARRANRATLAAVILAPPVDVECVRHETATPWNDHAGVAVELTWSAPDGSMRAVVALADEGDAAEASVARTDASGATWLTNLGTTALTWIVAGRPITVAPGAAVRVVAWRSAGA